MNGGFAPEIRICLCIIQGDDIISMSYPCPAFVDDLRGTGAPASAEYVRHFM